MNNQETNGRTGYSGYSLLLWFAGGALAGAAAAYLAQAQNRAHVRELAQHTRDQAGRLPKALHDASSAAQSAFAQAYRGNSEPVAVVEHK
jgi:hypothetical protein